MSARAAWGDIGRAAGGARIPARRTVARGGRVKDPDLSSNDAAMRLFDQAKRYRKVESACVFSAVASALGVVLVDAWRHPITAVFAVLAVSSLVAAMLRRAQMRRANPFENDSMIEQWERAQTRHDAAFVLRDLLRELGRTHPTSPARGADDPMILALDEELDAELARRRRGVRAGATEIHRARVLRRGEAGRRARRRGAARAGGEGAPTRRRGPRREVLPRRVVRAAGDAHAHPEERGLRGARAGVDHRR